MLLRLQISFYFCHLLITAIFYEYNEWATVDDGSCDVYWQALYYDGVWEIDDLEEEVVDLQNAINTSNNSYEALLAQLEAVQNLLVEAEKSILLSVCFQVWNSHPKFTLNTQ